MTAQTAQAATESPSRALTWAQQNPAPRNTPTQDDADPWRAVLVVTDADALADTYLPPRSQQYRERGNGRFPVEYGPTARAWVEWLAADHNANHKRPGAHMEAEPINPRPAPPAADAQAAPPRWVPDGPPPAGKGLPTRLTVQARRRAHFDEPDDAPDWPILAAARAVTASGDDHREAWSVIAQMPHEGDRPHYVVGLVVGVGYGDGYALRTARAATSYREAVGLMCDGIAGGRLH